MLTYVAYAPATSPTPAANHRIADRMCDVVFTLRPSFLWKTDWSRPRSRPALPPPVSRSRGIAPRDEISEYSRDFHAGISCTRAPVRCPHVARVAGPLATVRG